MAPSIDGDQVEVTICMVAAPGDWERFAAAVRDVAKQVSRSLKNGGKS